MAQFLVAADIPVESEEDRVVRPPRQTCHRKGSGEIVGNGIISTTGSNWGTREKSRASAKGASVGRVYREVSFDYFVNQR